MLVNNDFYRHHSDLTYFGKYLNYPDIREDTPLVFIPKTTGSPVTLICATSTDPGLQGIEFNNSMGTDTFYYNDELYTMQYHRKDGGISWDGYDALISSITTPIDITGRDSITIRGSVYTNNSSLDYSIFISLTKDLPPARPYGSNYDFTGWREILTGDHNIASTNVTVSYDITVPISELTNETGLVYFNYAVRHNQNIRAYSIHTGIKDLIFSSVPIY